MGDGGLGLFDVGRPLVGGGGDLVSASQGPGPGTRLCCPLAQLWVCVPGVPCWTGVLGHCAGSCGNLWLLSLLGWGEMGGGEGCMRVICLSGGMLGLRRSQGLEEFGVLNRMVFVCGSVSQTYY